MLPENRCFVRTLWGILSGALLLALLAVPEPRAEARSRVRCFAVPHEASPSQDGEEAPRHGTRRRHFDAYETSALELDVHCLGQPPSELRVQVFLPNGDTYETLDAVSLAETTPPSGRGRRRRPLATARLPIAGTFITQYGLVGTWTARACWEEGSRPSCGRPVRFSLER